MDGGRVRERKLVRNIELEYSYDRLIDMKIIQVYQLLVPDKDRKRDISQHGKSRENVTSRHIREGVIGASKRRAHY